VNNKISLLKLSTKDWLKSLLISKLKFQQKLRAAKLSTIKQPKSLRKWKIIKSHIEIVI